jgi:hypothetical protein
MNLDFGAEPAFSWYVVLLMISGLALVGMASVSRLEQSKRLRIFSLLAGLGFFGYGFYLGFLFQGGTYVVFYKALIVPVVLIVGAVRSALTRRRTRTSPPPAGYPATGLQPSTAWGPPAQPGQPGTGLGQPGQPAPGLGQPVQPGASWDQPVQQPASGLGQPGQPGAQPG